MKLQKNNNHELRTVENSKYGAIIAPYSHCAELLKL
jgi:hypothetical protein